jgi:hypothetical protein
MIPSDQLIIENAVIPPSVAGTKHFAQVPDAKNHSKLETAHLYECNPYGRS